MPYNHELRQIYNRHRKLIGGSEDKTVTPTEDNQDLVLTADAQQSTQLSDSTTNASTSSSSSSSSESSDSSSDDEDDNSLKQTENLTPAPSQPLYHLTAAFADLQEQYKQAQQEFAKREHIWKTDLLAMESKYKSERRRRKLLARGASPPKAEEIGEHQAQVVLLKNLRNQAETKANQLDQALVESSSNQKKNEQQIDNYQQKNADLTKQISELRESIGKYKEELQAKTKENAQLKETSDNLRQMKVTNQTTIMDLRIKEKTLSLELEELKSSLKDQKAQVEDLTRKLTAKTVAYKATQQRHLEQLELANKNNKQSGEITKTPRTSNDISEANLEPLVNVKTEPGSRSTWSKSQTTEKEKTAVSTPAQSKRKLDEDPPTSEQVSEVNRPKSIPVPIERVSWSPGRTSERGHSPPAKMSRVTIADRDVREVPKKAASDTPVVISDTSSSPHKNNIKLADRITRGPANTPPISVKYPGDKPDSWPIPQMQPYPDSAWHGQPTDWGMHPGQPMPYPGHSPHMRLEPQMHATQHPHLIDRYIPGDSSDRYREGSPPIGNQSYVPNRVRREVHLEVSRVPSGSVDRSPPFRTRFNANDTHENKHRYRGGGSRRGR